ncbi:hypothetical protein [Longimicrobium sp.]|nr:hypothetical protein [Longimicrobium sp.]HSU15668.1 hypothetical protein [Longimicrobium sp.]
MDDGAWAGGQDAHTARTATGADKAEAQRLLAALGSLDAAGLNDNWITP